MKTKHLFAVALTFALGLGSCADDDPVTPEPESTTHFGSAVKVGDDSARTYVKVDKDGNPTAIGIAIDADGLKNIPDGHPQFGLSLTLPLPNEANSKLPYKHVTLDWNKVGHEPVMFEVGHFDMHFYTITESEKMNIGADSSKLYKDPNPREVPADYTGYVNAGPLGLIAVGGVPMMGWHFTDSTDAIVHGHHTFDHIFIYGFYNGKMNFMEPMITKAFLESKADVTTNIKQPLDYLNSGNYWPTKYRIHFDATTSRHIIEMNTMVQR